MYMCTNTQREDCYTVIPTKNSEANKYLVRWIEVLAMSFFFIPMHGNVFIGLFLFPISNEGDRYFQIFLLTVMETEAEAKIFL